MTKKHASTNSAGKPMGNIQEAKAEPLEQKPKSKHRVRNWAKYNNSLKQRGNITLWIDEDVIRAWRPDPNAPKKRGGQPEYSDGAIECLLTVKAVFHLAYRQTEGFAGSVSELLRVKLPIPDYTTLNRRAKGLKIQLPTSEKGSIHLVLDSTGLKVYGETSPLLGSRGATLQKTDPFPGLSPPTPGRVPDQVLGLLSPTATLSGQPLTSPGHRVE